jgi:hypothetical protein
MRFLSPALQVNGSLFKRDEMAIVLVPDTDGGLTRMAAKIEGSDRVYIYDCPQF